MFVLQVLCLFFYEIKSVEKLACSPFIHLIMQAVKNKSKQKTIYIPLQTETFQI